MTYIKRETPKLTLMYKDGWGGIIVQEITFDEESPEEFLAVCTKFLAAIFCEKNVEDAIIDAADEIRQEEDE